MPDRRKIEDRGALEVKRLIASCDLLSESIPTGDKGMAMDGRISVFMRTTESKSGCLGEFPVQVKGKAESSYSDSHTKYPVSAEDLRYYYEVTFGVLYFVVCGTHTQNPKVYYSSLLPYDLKPLVDELSETGRKSKTLRFKPFPTERKEIERFCRNFLSDFQKQAGFRYSGIRDVSTLRERGEEVRQLTFDRVLYDGESLASTDVFVGDTYLYASTSAGHLSPVDKLSEPSLVLAGTDRVLKSGDITYVETVMVGEAKDGVRHISFPCFELAFAPDNAKLSYMDAGPFRQRFKAALLAKSMLQGNSLSIDGVKIFNRLSLDRGVYPDIDVRCESYREVVAFMDALAIKSDWDPNEFAEADGQKLNALIASMMHNESVHADLDPQAIASVTICGERIRVFAQEQGEGRYRLYDVLGPDAPRFGVSLGELEDDKVYEIPALLMFGVEDYRYSANLDSKVLLNAFDSTPLSSQLSDYATRSLLDMLMAWDMGAAHPDELLSCAEVLCAHIEAVGPGPICVVNKLQIAKRRHGELDEEDITLFE